MECVLLCEVWRYREPESGSREYKKSRSRTERSEGIMYLMVPSLTEYEIAQNIAEKKLDKEVWKSVALCQSSRGWSKIESRYGLRRGYNTITKNEVIMNMMTKSRKDCNLTDRGVEEVQLELLGLEKKKNWGYSHVTGWSCWIRRNLGGTK